MLLAVHLWVFDTTAGCHCTVDFLPAGFYLCGSRENLLRLHYVEQIPQPGCGLQQRLVCKSFKHKNKWFEDSFTARYSLDMLVNY
jgi:hypothetical protein